MKFFADTAELADIQELYKVASGPRLRGGDG